MSAKYKSPSFLLPNELNTSANTANDTGINSLYSIDFNQTSGYVISNDALITGNQSRSISVWAKSFVDLTGAFDNQVVFSLGTGSIGNRTKFAIKIRGSQRVQIDAKSYNVDFTSSYPGANWGSIDLNDHQWHHYVVTYATDDLKLYVDGTFIAGSTNYNSLVTQDGFLIGAWYRNGAFADYFLGEIDEVSVFNRVLNTTEIAALYDGTGSNKRPSNLIASNLNPIAYYPLGEQAQNTGKLPEATANVWQFPNGVLQDYVMDFDGTDAINTSSISDFEFIHNSKVFTISAWFNLDSLSTPVKKTIIQNTYTASAGSGFNLWIDNRSSAKKIRFNLDDQSTPTAIDYTYSSMATGKWVNVIVTGGGPGANNCKMFINGGTAVASATLGSATSVNSNYSAIIGSRVDSDSASFFNGQLSNIAIWNTDQSANIADIYNNGSPQTTYTVTPQNWWKLNADSVYTPSAPNYTTALDFDGADDYIDCGTSQLVDFNSSFTISAWVYITSTASGYDAVYAFKGASHAFVMFFNNGVGYSPISFGSANYPTDGTIRCATNVTINQWNNIVVVYNGNGIATPSNYTFYINNKSQTLTTSSGFSNVVNANYIGRYDASHDFDGSISNVAVFNSALSPSQVSTLFNFGTPETNISFSPQAWWKLDNTTTGIQDSSGNGNNGTNNGATQVSSSVAVVPSWKIPSALNIPTINYTKSLEFDPSGSGDYISFGNQSAFKPASNYTFSIWFNGDSASYALFGTNSSTGTGVHASLTGSKILYYHGNQPVLNVAHAGLNIWQNFIVTWSSSTGIIRTFIDGKYVDQRTGVNSITWSNDLEVGRYNGGAFKYDGKLSNFAMWNTTLTDGFSGTPTQGNVAGGQVAEVYNLGQPQASITGSPVGWWKLDDQNTITDYSGNNYTGTNNGAVDATGDVTTSGFNIPVNGVSTTLPSTALQQSDLQFDSPYSNYSLKFSTSQSIDTNFTLPASYTSYSYSFWYRSTAASIGTGDHYIISNFDSSNTSLSGTRGAVRFNNSTKMRIFGGDNTNYYLRQYEVGSSLLDQQWHNVVVTFTNTEVLLYIDGVSISAEITTNTPITGFTANRSYTIGQSGINSGYLINSKLDEFAIFNKKLTEAEILSIYNNGKPNDISSLSPTNWWRLGENAYFVNNNITLPNSISGAPNGVSSGTATSMLSADAPGTYANGIGTNLDILDRVGDAPLSVANSQSYNMIPDDKSPYVPGYIGLQTNNIYSMSFDANNGDYFDLSTALKSTFDAATTASVSLWFKANSISSSTAAVLFQQESNDVGDNWSFVVRFSTSGQLQTGIKVGSSFPLATYTTGLNTGVWYNVVSVYENSTLKLYLNGTKVAENLSTGSPIVTSSSNAKAIIGATSRPNRYFNGQIDEVAIWGTALNADQIKFDLYNASLPLSSNKTADIANNPNLPTPVAWYRMGD